MRCGIYVRVSTDDQRDNGYSIDSQLRMIKEYCEKNRYDIVDVYNDAGHSGKDLMRPEMQRLLKDIKSHKIEVIVAIKVDRLTRNNYDGFWLLNYCEEHDVKIELILEPYDVSTANGEMIFGMNLVFGQRERKEIGTSSYTMSPKQWIQRTNAIGLISKGGKYSIGTYAHPDLAFEFASWLNVEFKLYLIKEFERLKQNESYQNKVEWSVRRELAKTNYRIHTDSIKENIIPTLTENQKQYVYANEADILNVALFGMTAKEWKNRNPSLDGNMRDYANILQLVILVNLENLNAEMINQGIPQSKRLERLNEIAKKQFDILQHTSGIKKIEQLDNNASKLLS